MDAPHWDELEVIFEKALALPPRERSAFLDTACRDATLRARMDSLLDAYSSAPAFFEDLGDAVIPLKGGEFPSAPSDAGHDPYELIGQRVSHYEILDLLGSGGMGVVYKARDTRLDRVVALKFLPPHLRADARAKERFKVEAKAASALDHPNVCTIHEINETAEGQLFIAMGYCEGETLRARLAHGPLSLDEAITVAEQTARGLVAAHAKGIVHRDVKPANIMQTSAGVVKIVDFGLAKMTNLHLTRSGVRMGTIAYMSPEQAQGKPVDHRTDIWSLGILLYEMATGRQPFRGNYDLAVLYALVHEQAPAVRSLRSDFPPAYERIVERCLEKDPARRYGSATEVLADLTRLKQAFSAGMADFLELPADRNRRRLAAAQQVSDAVEVPALPVPAPQRAVERAARPLHRRRSTLIGAAVAAALLLLALLAAALAPASFGAFGGLFGTAGLPEEKSIAILPFRNLSGDATDQVFCDGLGETLVSKLSQLQQYQQALLVVPSSDVRKLGITSAREARRAGVNLVLEGSMQRDGDLVRLTLSLVNAETGRTVDSQIMTERMTSVFGMQDGVFLKLVEMLHLEVQPETQRIVTAGGTDLPGAYEFYLQGLGYLQRYEKPENLDNAITLFQRALAEDGDYPLARAGLAEAYWRKYTSTQDARWIAEAEALGEQVIERNPHLGRAHETLGLIYAGTGRHGEAVQAFERALAIDPVSASAFTGLAKAYEGQGRKDLAEETYRKAIDLKRNYWAAYNALGSFFLRESRYEEALAPLQQIILLTPDNHFGYINLGLAYFHLNDWEKARLMFERSLEIEPGYLAYLNLGTMFYYEGRYTDAARMFEEVLAFNDQDWLTQGNLASAYRYAPGEAGKAPAAYRRAIEMAEAHRNAVNSRDPQVIGALATYYVMIGSRDRARALIEQALDLAPQDDLVMFYAAHTYEQLGDRDRALQYIRRALESGFSVTMIDAEPGLQQLRADPRFQAIRARTAPS